MSQNKSFYITTTLPYVNAEPHIGFAMEIIHADIIARAKKLQGFEVFFNTGTDEYGQKIWQKAKEKGEDTQKYVDTHAESFKNLISLLGIGPDINFIRTTSSNHKKAAKEIWKRCQAAGDIYKKNYTIKYCVGCELEKTDSEIENDHCMIHPHLELEIREEENYFFRFSKYSQKLLDLYEKNPSFVIPDYRLNEVKVLIERGLEDFSISRLKAKMPWGVEVPGDDEHVMYVWFDALTSYISTLGWPDNNENFDKFWINGAPVQFAGKDQIRQQAAMWQAILLSAGITPSKHIVIHGFLNISGQKMSKSLGNVISPKEMVEKFGQEASRVIMAGVNQFEDTDVSMDGFILAYNSNLANGLGNLVSRIMTLAQDHLKTPAQIAEHEDMSEFFYILDKFEIKNALEFIWRKVGNLDKKIQDSKPWESKDQKIISELVTELYSIARMLNPFMPETSAKIKELVKTNKKRENLFPRIN